MAKQEQDERTAGQRIGDNFRRTAGLGERSSDGPTDPAEASELTLATEPEGGYGGEDGISNSGALSADEARHLERQVKTTDEDGLSGGETATEVARLTGEDTTDVKPAATVGDDVAEDEEA